MSAIDQRAVRDRRVTFEVFPSCTAGRFGAKTHERIGQACLATGAIVSARPFGALLVECAPSLIATFCELVKAIDPPRYLSPTVFDNGTIIAIHATPEDELAGTWREWALRAQKRIDEQREREDAAFGGAP